MSILKKFLKSLGLKPFLKKQFRKVNLTYSISINNKKFKGLLLYGSRMISNEYWMLDILKPLLSLNNKAFLDIGVNIGQTLLKVKSIDDSRQYCGFEPNPSCIMYCEELVRINKLKNVDLVPVGLFTENKVQSMDLYEDDLANSGGSVINNYWSFNNHTVKRKVNVPLMTYETVEPSLEYTECGIIKIDVEGAELEVLKSLDKLITNQKPVIIMEVLSAYSIENKVRYERQLLLSSLIKKLNYNIFQVVENKDEHLKKLRRIDDFDVDDNHNDCNYVLCHESNVSLICEKFEAFLI